jgi:hypothetical protein
MSGEFFLTTKHTEGTKWNPKTGTVDNGWDCNCRAALGALASGRRVSEAKVSCNSPAGGQCARAAAPRTTVAVTPADNERSVAFALPCFFRGFRMFGGLKGLQ